MIFTFFGLDSAQWLDLGISLLIVAAVLILGRRVLRRFIGWGL